MEIKRVKVLRSGRTSLDMGIAYKIKDYLVQLEKDSESLQIVRDGAVGLQTEPLGSVSAEDSDLQWVSDFVGSISTSVHELLLPDGPEVAPSPDAETKVEEPGMRIVDVLPPESELSKEEMIRNGLEMLSADSEVRESPPETEDSESLPDTSPKEEVTEEGEEVDDGDEASQKKKKRKKKTAGKEGRND